MSKVTFKMFWYFPFLFINHLFLWRLLQFEWINFVIATCTYYTEYILLFSTDILILSSNSDFWLHPEFFALRPTARRSREGAPGIESRIFTSLWRDSHFFFSCPNLYLSRKSTTFRRTVWIGKGWDRVGGGGARREPRFNASGQAGARWNTI